MTTPAEVIAFWKQAGPPRWFRSDPAFDQECRVRFGEAHLAAARRACDGWMDSADGALALLLLLDQMPRNIYRGTAHAYATDPLARHFAGRALAQGLDQQVEAGLRSFCYLPFEHSEALADQERAVALFAALPGDDPAAWARKHHAVIARFGRFPHRNAALGRTSTPEEQAWLDAGGGF